MGHPRRVRDGSDGKQKERRQVKQGWDWTKKKEKKQKNNI
jgi:hypothetical protein